MNTDFNILIVDDELIIAEMISGMLVELDYTPIGIAENYKEALEYLLTRKDIDMVIIDINLSEDKNGIDIGNEINDKFGIPFIYLTSYSDPQTIRKAALTTPTAYLLKPFTKSDLFTTIEIIKARKYQNNKAIVIKDGIKNVKIRISDILFIKSDNNYIELITDNKKYILRNSLEKFLDDLASDVFFRIHRSYAINITKIEAMAGTRVMVGGQYYPVSRVHKDQLLQLLKRGLESKI